MVLPACGAGKLKLVQEYLEVATKHRAWFENPRYSLLARKHGHEIREIDVPPEKWPKIVDASRGNHNAPDDPQRVGRLIRRRQDVNVRDHKGKTARYRASQAGFVKITSLLLKHRADIEATSLDGETPLFDAALYWRVDQIERLVSRGAELEVMNNRKETPIFAVARGGKKSLLKN